MPSRLRPFIICFAALAMVLGACSSSTIVSQGSRGSASGETSSQDSATVDAEEQNDSDAAGEADGEQTNESSAANESSDDDTDDPPTAAELEQADGFGLGGSEQIGALLSDCEAGSPIACDVLFHLSDFDTAEEAVALSCGGRGDSIDGFCTEGIVAAPGEIYFDDESEGLAAVVDRCVDDGDMTACDFLFFRSGLNSEVEQIGATCGDRVKVAVPDCRTFLAAPE